MMKKRVYRILFVNQGEVYEVYARQVGQSGMMGFVEIEGLIFGEKSNVVIDPSEERLKNQFGGVERTYVPMHAVIRIDEVEKEGTAKVTSVEGNVTNISGLPGSFLNPANKPGDKNNRN